MINTRLMAVDPEGCGCTDCLTGYSVPSDKLTTRWAIKLHFSKLIDRTSGFKTDLNVTLIDVRTLPNDRSGGTVAAATLVGGYGDATPSQRQTWDVTEIMQCGDLCCDCVGDCDCDDVES